MSQSHTAGTAGAGYRTEPLEHDYQPDPRTDYGQRPVCVCGREMAAHLPTQRRAS